MEIDREFDQFHEHYKLSAIWRIECMECISTQIRKSCISNKRLTGKLMVRLLSLSTVYLLLSSFDKMILMFWGTLFHLLFVTLFGIYMRAPQARPSFVLHGFSEDHRGFSCRITNFTVTQIPPLNYPLFLRLPSVYVSY